MATIRTTNNPKMLRWARKDIGYTIEQASKAIGLAEATLEAAENGDHQLTLVQLRKIADAYETPFGFFYLAEQPYERKYKPIPDYRMDPDLVGVYHHRLQLEIKKVRDRREVYLELARDLRRDFKPFDLIQDDSPINAGRVARNRLSITRQAVSRLPFDQVYAFWKSRIENDGVLVYESQYLPIASGVIGVAIYYETLPIILIKRGADANARRLFTLLHEYAHLLQGQSAINDSRAQLVRENKSAEESLETYCNQVAAEMLIPSADVDWHSYDGLTHVEKMVKLANSFKVTYTTAAVCLTRSGIIDYQEFADLLRMRKDAYQKKTKAEKKEVRIPRENIMRLDLGRPLFDAVLTAYGQGLLDVLDASRILNLRVKKIDGLMTSARQ